MTTTQTEKKTAKDLVAEVKGLAVEHRGKPVVTGWAYTDLRFHWVGSGKGCKGTIKGWGMDGPYIDISVDEDDPKPPLAAFYPGGSHMEKNRWGEGRTWKFSTKEKADA